MRKTSRCPHANEDHLRFPAEGPRRQPGAPKAFGESPISISPSSQACGIADSGTTSRPRVLLVEDTPSVLFMLQKALENMGFEVDTADSLEAALDFLPGFAYRAVITDLKLGGDREEQGLSVLSASKVYHPGADVILLTGFGNPDVMNRAFEMGASFYLEKPVSLKRLKSALQGDTP